MTKELVVIVTSLTIAFILFVAGKVYTTLIRHHVEHKELAICKNEFSGLNNRFEINESEHGELKEALVVIAGANMQQMKISIIALHKKHVTRQMITVQDREAFDELCEGYYAVDGNGVVATLQSEVQHLETEI